MAATERDPAIWLLEQSMFGRKQDDVALQLNEALRETPSQLEQWLTGCIQEDQPYELAGEKKGKKKGKIEQYTISRNVTGFRAGKKLTPEVKRGILAVFVREEELDRLIDEWQGFFLAFMDALQEWKILADFNEGQALLRLQQEEEDSQAFEYRQGEARDACKAANDIVKARGFMAPDQSYIWGDGQYFYNAGISEFVYATVGALIVGFAEPENMFACRLTAEELRDGITPEQRMQLSAVPAGESRPRMIGLRDAFEILTDPYPDMPWFLGSIIPTSPDGTNLESRHRSGGKKGPCRGKLLTSM